MTLRLVTMMVWFLTAPGGDGSANPCSNGSFERLAPSGFPVDWAPLGKVEVVADAHSGQRALRLLRTTEPAGVETGINGRNIDRLKGGMDFYYKAVSAKDAVLHIYAIPIAADGIEKTGSPRAGFIVPQSHIGDGQWHHGRLKYDFTKNPKVKSVIFAARLEGTAGELLLDDISYVERVGPLLRLGTMRIEEDPTLPGERCTVSVPVENTGDEAAEDVRVAIDIPQGLKAEPADVRLGRLAPDAKHVARWTLDGPRLAESRLKIAARSGPVQAESVLRIAPELVVSSWGPTSPVLLGGQPITVECVLSNPGHAMVLKPAVRVSGAVASAERIAPGRSVTLAAVVPSFVTAGAGGVAIEVSLEVRAENVRADRLKLAKSRALVAVLPNRKVPAPSGTLKAEVTAEYAVLENEHVRLVFRQSTRMAGIGQVMVHQGSAWREVGWVRPGKGSGGPTTWLWPPSAQGDGGRKATLSFSGQLSSPAPAAESPGSVRASFELAPGSKVIRAVLEMMPERPGQLQGDWGFDLCVLDRDEAVFPGVEWLVGEELSSGSLDIAESHPDRIRAVVHPNWITIPAMAVHGKHGTVGLLWDAHQRWDGTRDRPGAYFVSPDQAANHRSHHMALFVPNPPEFVKPNTWEIESAKPYRLEPGKRLTLEALIYADGEATDALTAIDEWVRRFGIPQPAALPRGSYEREIEFSMQAYLKSLWVPEEQQWWTTKGGGMMSDKDRPRSFIADLLLGELLSPDPEVRRQCRARAEEVLKLIGGQARLDAQRFPGRLDQSLANPLHVAGLLLSRGDDGAWRFDADQVGTGPFVGMDYHELGPDNAAEVGTCAARATAILRYARITGDWETYRQMQKTLEFMEQFRVPRAAQVWEVPVHTPDILAAAEACEAYLEAYRFSRNPRWLRNAVAWARRGLPFVYLWSDPERPYQLGASIPVFGATWMQGSWFGRPVQWNGLRYAEAIWELAEHDQSYPWRQIAAAITHSAIHQQDSSGENVALWPDNVGIVRSDKCPWVFSPRMILANLSKLMGRDEEISTVIVAKGLEKGGIPLRGSEVPPLCPRLHISATAKLTDAAWDGSTCRFRATYPPGEQGVVVLFNIARPQQVLLDGKPLAEREDIESGTEPGWRYDEGLACLSIRIARDGTSVVSIAGAQFREVARLPRMAERIAFEFDSLDGWIAMHHVADLAARDGHLVGRVTGPDPYLGRLFLRVRADDCSVLALRMRVTAGGGGQVFWMTEASPSFTEDKSIRVAVQPDGQFHEYRLEMGKHPAWSGQTITGLRIDPCGGTASGEFAVDYVRGGQ